MNFANLLSALQERVEAVDASLTAAVGEVARIMADLADAKLVFAEGCGAPNLVNKKSHTQRNVQLGECSSPRQKTSQHMHDMRDGRTCLGSASKSSKNPPTEVADPRGATLSDPLEVQEDASSHSADTNSGGPPACSKRACVAKRVHHNPRQRVVPCATRLGVSRPLRSTVDAILHPASDTRSQDANYQDPPGYDGVADFGRTSDLQYTGPPLQPRKNSVSTLNERIMFFNVRHKLSCSQLTWGLLGVADSSTPWDTLLGSASRLPQRGHRRGESRSEQQIAELPRAFGFVLQGWRAVHSLQKSIPPRHAASLWG